MAFPRQQHLIPYFCKTMTARYMGTLTGEKDYAVFCKMRAQFPLFMSLFFLFIIWLQWHSDGVFDQCDNSPRVPAMGGVRPHTQSEGGQGSGCTQYSNRWAFISLIMHTDYRPFYTEIMQHCRNVHLLMYATFIFFILNKTTEANTALVSDLRWQASVLGSKDVWCVT